MKRTFAVLMMVGALFTSAPLSAQAKPDWSKVKPEAAAPATNLPAPANDKGTGASNEAQPKPAPVPQKPPVVEAPTDLAFPKLTGRVVDQAGLLSAAQVADLTAKSDALEKATGRQFVVATVPGLNGRTIEDYGYQLGRAWGIGQEKQDDGVILLVAPNQRKVRIETGYGARVFLTDAVSSVIIRETILPAFRNGDMGGGIVAGADQIIDMMQLPPAEAAKRAQQVGAAEAKRQQAAGSPGILPVIFWMFIILFVIIPMVRGLFGGGGRKYRRGRHGHGGPIILWGPGGGSGWGGGGGSDWGGGGGGFGGGFSGGGGSFGGGGASGSW